MKYIPAIDGLRAVAVLLVVLCHTGRTGPVPGAFGVTLFFFLSGFLITGLLIDELERSHQIHFARFYWRRFRRLGPALLVMVAVMSALFWLWFRLGSWTEMAAGVFYFMNYYQIANVEDLPNKLVILWSLAVEEHFYLLFPLVMAVAWRFGWRLLAALLLTCLAVLLWRCHLIAIGWPPDRTYLATDTRIDSILYGCILCIALRRGYDLDWLAHPAALALASVALLASLTIPSTAFQQTLGYTLQGLALMPLFYHLLTRRSRTVGLLESEPMVWIGKLSYSIYLWHFPIIQLCLHLAAPRSAQLAIAAAATFLMSVVSYYCVEQPLRIVSAPPADPRMERLGRRQRL